MNNKCKTCNRVKDFHSKHSVCYRCKWNATLKDCYRPDNDKVKAMDENAWDELFQHNFFDYDV